MTDVDLEALRDELEEFAQPKQAGGRSARDERIIAGFEEVQRFVATQGRVPQHGEGLDIFERLYAVRLDRLRALPECRSLLEPLDHQELLGGVAAVPATPEDSLSDADLAAELRTAGSAEDITQLRHVRTRAEKRAAEDIETRAACDDFEQFKPLFEAAQRQLKAGVREMRPFAIRSMNEIEKGSFFVVGGQMAYIAEVGMEFTTQYDRRDSRLRVVYDNGTQSRVLMRSLQRAWHRDAGARYLTNPDAGPLFADRIEEEDLASGTIYVLRSRSDNPVVAAHREVLHKIGVTGGRVEARIAEAKLDPTFLMAEVEVVATYELYNINRVKLENLIHRVFDPARLDIQIMDRFGKPVVPREWFLVPVFVVDEAVGRIRDGSITGYVYDPKAARLVYVA